MPKQRFRTSAREQTPDPKRGGLGNIRDRNAAQASAMSGVMDQINRSNGTAPAPKKPAPKKPASDGYVFGSMTGDPLLGGPKKPGAR